MISRLNVRSRPGRPTRVGQGAGGGGGGGGGASFFGEYAMLREFWAEDPDWTNPGNNTVMTSWRDAGSAGNDVAAAGGADAVRPHYMDSLINSKPGIDFRATGGSTGGVLSTVSTTSAASWTIVIVGRFDQLYSNVGYMTDRGGGSLSRGIIGFGALAADGQWNIYANASVAGAGGSSDTADHLIVGVFAEDDLRLYIDGTLTASDSAGTIDAMLGITIGGHIPSAGTLIDGAISYLAQYNGDLTADGGYAAWASALATYYGITLA